MAKFTYNLSAGDNNTRREVVTPESFSTIRDGAQTASLFGTEISANINASTSPSDTFERIIRGMLRFSWGTFETPITKAVLNMDVIEVVSSFGSITPVYIAGTSAYGYENVERVKFSDGITTSGEQSIELNSNALDVINENSTYIFSLQTGWDIEDAAPTWVSDGVGRGRITASSITLDLYTSGFTPIAKPTSTWVDETKPTSSWVDETKPTSTWTDIAKTELLNGTKLLLENGSYLLLESSDKLLLESSDGGDTWTPVDKSSATWTNISKS